MRIPLLCVHRHAPARVRRRVCVCTLAALAASGMWGGPAAAATISWKTDSWGNWAIGTNWSGNVVPPAGSVVIISRPSANPTVSYTSGTRTITQLICDDDFLISGGELIVDGAAATQFKGFFTFDGGKISTTGGGDVQFFTPGLFWNAGTLGGSGSGKFVVRSGAHLNVFGTNGLEKAILQDMDINGGLTLTASIDPANLPCLRVGGGVTITNNNALSIHTQVGAHSSIASTTTTATLNNSANTSFTLTVAAGGYNFFGKNMVINNSGATNFDGPGWAISQGTFNNNGYINASNGIFQFDGGGTNNGTILLHNALLFVTGPGYNVANGSIGLDATSQINFSAGASTVDINYVNPGTVTIDQGSSATFNGNFDSIADMINGTARFNGTSNLRAGSTLRGASMKGTGALNITGLNWTHGTIDGGANNPARTVVAGGQMNIDANDEGRNDLISNLTNNGTVFVTSGKAPSGSTHAFLVAGSATITNNGVFTLHSLGTPEHNSIGGNGSGLFDNFGFYNIEVEPGGIVAFGGGMATANHSNGSLQMSGGGFARCDGAYTSSGKTHVSGGILQLNGGGSASGDFNINANSILFVTQSFIFKSNAQINTAPSAQLGFGGGESDVSSSYVNAGIVYVEPGATANFYGAFDSAADLRGGTIRFSGPSANLRAGSTLRGANLSGAANLSIAGLNWTNGTISGLSVPRTVTVTGQLDIDANDAGRNDLNAKVINNGTIVVTSGTPLSPYAFNILNDVTITNNGTFTLHSVNKPDHASFGTTGSATFTNNASGRLNLDIDTGGFDRFGYNMTFHNAGGVFKTGGGFAASQGRFNNTGSVNVNGGVLELAGGGTSSGTFNVGGNSILYLTNSYNFTGGAVNIDAGSQVNFYQGTFNVPMPWVNSGTTTIENGTVTFNSTFDSAIRYTGSGTATFNGSTTLRGDTLVDALQKLIADIVQLQDQLIINNGGQGLIRGALSGLPSSALIVKGNTSGYECFDTQTLPLVVLQDNGSLLVHRASNDLLRGFLKVGSSLTFSGTSGSVLTLEAGSDPGVLGINATLSSTASNGTSQIVTTVPAAGELPGRVDLGGAVRVLSVANVPAVYSDFIIQAPLTNGGIQKQGPGTLLLLGSNTYTMGTTIDNGIVEVRAPTSLGTGSVLFQGGTLSVLSDLASTTIPVPMVAAAGTTSRLSIGTINSPTAGTIQFPQSTFGTKLLLTGAGTVSIAGATLLNDLTLENFVPLTINGPIGGNFGITRGGSDGSSASVTLSGSTANTYTGATIVNRGTLLLAKSSGNAVPANLSIAGGMCKLLASHQIADTSAVALTGGSIDLNGCIEKIGSLATQTGASLFVNRGVLITGNPVSDIKGQIGAGQIVSGVNGRVLGIATAASLGTNSFMGVGLDANSVVIRDTWLGDANLDGLIGTADFSALSLHFNQTTPLWSDGDFNGDSRVNAMDFNALASNFGKAVAADVPVLAALVPEPAMLAPGLLMTLLTRRCASSRRTFARL